MRWASSKLPLPLLLVVVALLLLRHGSAATNGGGGLTASLADAVAEAAMPAPMLQPEARYLFYDILEHEQLNKQRKGFMYALKVAHGLGRELVLHRLRVRKYEAGAQQKLSHWQGRPPQFTHTFYPWRKFFNMSLLSEGIPRAHEFDVLMFELGAGEQDGFTFDHVLYMNKLLEGRRDKIGIHDR